MILLSLPGLSKNRKYGLGVIIGEPTGISGNYRLNTQNNISAALAFNSDIYMHGIYSFQKPNSFKVDQFKFGWYFGIGGQLQFKKDTSDNNEKKYFMGPRGVIGVNLPIERDEFDIFGETALFLSILPKTDVIISLSVGGRIYF
jgi:hypothetical protein